VDEVAAAILALDEGTRLNVLFPVLTPAADANTTNYVRAVAGGAAKKSRGPSRKAKAQAAEEVSAATKTRLFELRQRGFNRWFRGGQVFEFSTPESLLEVNFSEPLFVLVDRISVSADSRARIVDAAEIGFRESGEVIFEVASRGDAPDATASR